MLEFHWCVLAQKIKNWQAFECGGFLKTSPCTSFQPVSSRNQQCVASVSWLNEMCKLFNASIEVRYVCASSPESSASISLYLAMSPQVESLIKPGCQASTLVDNFPMPLFKPFWSLLHLNLCQAIFGKPLHSLLCAEMLAYVDTSTTTTRPLESGQDQPMY